jgi:hypothetical protein
MGGPNDAARAQTSTAKPKTRKHDYTHKPATKEQLQNIARLLMDVEGRGGRPSSEDIELLTATLPKGSAEVGTGDYSGLIGWKISWTSTQGHRYFHPFLIAAERLLTPFEMGVTFAHSQLTPATGVTEHTLFAQISCRNRHNGSGAVGLNRLTMDAQEGERVKEGRDYHDCSPRALTITAGWKSAPARATAIRAAEAEFSKAEPEQRAFPTWEETRSHIDRAFRLLDADRLRLASTMTKAPAA